MQNLSANTAVTIILIIAVVVSASILFLRDRWRDRTGMPAAERRQQEQTLARRTSQFFGAISILGGSWCVAELLRGHQPSRGGSYGVAALLLFLSGYFNLRRPET